ncbi:MAG TPA: undecaprenyl-diphosphate phosphatase [Candidatus Saccharimonadales bacterium]|nr:undecaprenyl-diphosphate phosphatase [Candidatus Saccharimonadales bacterium]
MINVYQVLVSIVIGLVQGISEWLPVSSKTQVLVASTYLLHLNFQQAYAFGLFMEVGTLAAAVIYFRHELASLIKALLGSRIEMDRKLLVYVVITTVITGIIGAPIYLVADSITGISLGIPMLLIGIILIADALIIRKSKKVQHGTAIRKFNDLKIKDYVLVGIAQGIAALPGVSRSGITTSTLLLMKVEPDEAFRLSFLIGIFATFAAFALTLIASKAKVAAAIASISLTGLGIAIVTSTLISLFLIDFLIKTAGKSRIVYVTAALGVIAMLSGSIYLLFGL